jgi:hypothetical protein
MNYVVAYITCLMKYNVAHLTALACALDSIIVRLDGMMRLSCFP